LPAVQWVVVMPLLEHTLVQPPQLAGSVLVLISQPFERLLVSQSAKPVVQVAPSHEPPEQAAAMFCVEQAWLQAPQFARLVLESVSQPLARLASQSRKLPLQVKVQLPPPQAMPVAWVTVWVQSAPQLPQLLVSVCRFLQVVLLQTVNPPRQLSVQVPLVLQAQLEPFVGTVPQPVQVLLAPCVQLLALRLTSQPSLTLPLQSRCVASQLGWQAPPAVQTVEPPVLVQAVPQAPQLVTLNGVSQPSSAVGAAGVVQLRKPAAQVEVHTLPAQLAVATWLTPAALQARPQPPQLATVLLTSTSQPSLPVLLQSRRVPEQAVQVPLLQVCVSAVQTALGPVHAPQCESSISLLTSQPSVAEPLQSAKFALQEYPQVLAAHVALALARLGQADPQPLQLAGSLVRSLHALDAAHQVWPLGQQWPLEQMFPPQLLLQLPQLAGSVCRFLQVLLLQTLYVAWQVRVQVPLELQAHEEPLAGSAPQPVQVLLAP
jgi:hypothetical protein